MSERRDEALRVRARETLAGISTLRLVGLGGIGGRVAREVVPLVAGLGAPVDIDLIDGDAFEPQDAGRMAFETLGPKARVVREELERRLWSSGVVLRAVEEFVTPANAERWIRDGDWVLLAVDNHATRKLVSDRLCTLSSGVLVSAGNDGVHAVGNRTLRGTAGNVQIHVRRQGRDLSPPITAYHPEIAEPRDHRPDELGCDRQATRVPQLQVANLQAAAALVSAFWLLLVGDLNYSELVFDVAEGAMRAERAVPGPGRPFPK